MPATPIVFPIANDPVSAGVVASLARPGGNVTGLANLLLDTVGKRLELLREIIPALHRLGVMTNIGFPEAVQEMDTVRPLAKTIGLEVLALEIRSGEDIVAKYMAKKGDDPSGQSWGTFLRNHAPHIAAMDLFVVPTIGFQQNGSRNKSRRPSPGMRRRVT